MAYLYRHIRLDKNEPFYIGISSDTGYRAKDIKKRNKIWKGITAKSLYEIEILIDNLTWEEACIKEIEFIKLYGRICNSSGCLANLSAGGKGYLNPSLEVRNKLSILKIGVNNPNFGKKLTKEHSIKLINAATGRVVSKETREKMSSAQKGKHRNMSGIKKYQDEIKKTGINPLSGVERSIETKLKISNSRLGIKFTKLHKQKLSEKKCKKVINIFNNKSFNSLNEASAFYNIPLSTFGRWVREQKNNFKFI